MEFNSLLCPFCLKIEGKSAGAVYKQCPSCGVVYNSNYTNLIYNDNYFLEEYKNQYGKTYIEDFDNIYNSSSLRLKLIKKFFHKDFLKESVSLLDIGSALGFFLKCALDSGIKSVKGIEISEFASNYCIDSFNIEVIKSSFDNISDPGNYDIITAWFFIEHCVDPLSVFKKIFDNLNNDGIFAFSVPSFFGPLFIFHRDQWIVTHPVDHRIDLSPSSAKKILKDIGFSKVIVRAAGFHPERIVNENSIFHKPFSFFYKIFSRITKFSDTIEIYAIK